MSELVVLINKQNKQIGTRPKAIVHTSATPLHRGFSLFIFNSKGELLLQKRALSKPTWPGVWSNSVCGHPGPKESFRAAALRRAKYELGIELQLSNIRTILPTYSYRYEHEGVVENEFCPVMAAFTSQTPDINPLEVEAVRWVKWPTFLADIAVPNEFSQWCVEEAMLLSHNSQFEVFYEQGTHESH